MPPTFGKNALRFYFFSTWLNLQYYSSRLYYRKIFLYEWFKEDLPVILDDYKRITDKIKQGKAYELSESDGNYLSTCTKGAGKGKDLKQQPYSDVPAKQRAWELKSSYMTYLINNKIFNKTEQESVIATATGTQKPFTQVIEEKIMTYKGKTASE